MNRKTALYFLFVAVSTAILKSKHVNEDIKNAVGALLALVNQE
jgi:hypothetical protein